MKTFLLVVLGVIVLIGALFGISSMTTIDSGERGLVINLGQITEVLDSGFHVVNPFTTDIVTLSTLVQREDVAAKAATKDLQSVATDVSVNYRLDGSKIKDIYLQVQKDWVSRWIQPKLQESVKAATAKYTAEETITKRELVREEIKQNLVSKLENTGIIVDDVNITNFDFSPQFNAAIESKVTAEQNAKQAENKLKQVEAEAKQSIARAQAEAESIKLQSAAANNDKYVDLKRLEVQLEFAKKWNGQLPTNIYGSAPIPFLELSK